MDEAEVEIDAQIVIDLLQADLQQERRRNLLLRAQLRQLEAERAPERPVG